MQLWTDMHWHVRESMSPGVTIHADELLMRVLTHESIDVRKQAAIGVGMGKLRAAADTCDAAGEHFEAAQLMWAVSAVPSAGYAAGAETKRAWASIKLLEEAGRGSDASRALELRVLNFLFSSSEIGRAHV